MNGISYVVGLVLVATASIGFAASQHVVVPVTNPMLYFSPYNTYSDGSGALLPNNVREGSSYVIWVNPGSYLKTTFRGTSAALEIAPTQKGQGQMPKVQWSVDDGPLETALLKKGSTELVLASNLDSSAAHVLWLGYSASDANLDRWKQPLASLKISGILLDRGSGLLAPSGSISMRKKRAIFFGDSITEGAWMLGTSTHVVHGQYVDWVRYGDATLAWPNAVAAALDAEYGICAFGGTSWAEPARPFVPPLPQSWSEYFSGHSRLTGGKLLPLPDYVLVNMGTNDGNRDTTQVIVAWLHQLRAALSQRTKIIMVVPFGQINRSRILAAVAQVQDPHLYTVDLGKRWAYGLHHYGKASLVSFDGLHPNEAATATYAAVLVAAIDRVLDRP